MTEKENQPSNTRSQASLFHSSIGSKLYLNSATADVTFIVGRNDDECERVPAHKVLLITASEVFEAMFNGSYMERNEVRIVDATTGSFKEFLQFFYLDEVKLTMENVSDVMNLGKKYGVDDCLDLCTDFIATKLTDDNVCWAYELAILFEHGRLRKFCELMISVETKKVFQSTSFTECEREVVHEILSLDAMDCTEVELFEAIMSWIKRKTKQNVLSKKLIRIHLGNSFGEFRFGSMSSEEFATLASSYSEIFSGKIHQEIIQLMASPEYVSKHFSDNREKRSDWILWSDEDSCDLDRSLLEHRSEKPYYIKDIENVIFSVDKPIFLSNFRCARILTHGMSGKGSHYKGGFDVHLSTRLTISKCTDRSEFNEENSIVLYTKKSAFPRKISLPKPILLQPGSMYQICYRQSLPDKWGLCTGVLLKPEMKIGPDTTVQFRHDSTLEGDKVARGLFQFFKFLKV